MPVRNLSYAVTIDSTSAHVISVDIDFGFKSPVTKCQIATDDAPQSWLGKDVSVAIGLDSLTTIFTGNVVDIAYNRPNEIYTITANNILDRAQKHYLVSSSLDTPWTRSSIAAETLVGDLLAEAGITNYSGWTSGFTFGVSYPVEFNLLSVLDAISQINNILATNIYVIGSTVYWDQTQPVPGTPTKTVSEFISVDYSYGTKDLRNKVVVFGRDGIYAEASAVSPYLPPDFYQTAIVSSEMIDQQGMADQAANYNLTLYNKLTEELRVDIEGDASISVRDTVTVENSGVGADADWFVYSVKHSFMDTFTSTLFLRR